MLKTAHIYFKDNKYNYATSVNGKLKNSEIRKYFEGKIFNLGHIEDDLQVCIACGIDGESRSLMPYLASDGKYHLTGSIYEEELHKMNCQGFDEYWQAKEMMDLYGYELFNTLVIN